jgi:hypothetical protein
VTGYAYEAAREKWRASSNDFTVRQLDHTVVAVGGQNHLPIPGLLGCQNQHTQLQSLLFAFEAYIEALGSGVGWVYAE